MSACFLVDVSAHLWTQHWPTKACDCSVSFAKVFAICTTASSSFSSGSNVFCSEIIIYLLDSATFIVLCCSIVDSLGKLEIPL